MFSPLGETKWVPGWRPELLFPPGVSWERGLVFRTEEERGDAVWIVTRLDHDGREVEYHRVEAGRYVARVTVCCAPKGGDQTEVRVSYLFIGLSEVGNDDVAAMTKKGYGEKMQRWQSWISAALR